MLYKFYKIVHNSQTDVWIPFTWQLTKVINKYVINLRQIKKKSSIYRKICASAPTLLGIAPIMASSTKNYLSQCHLISVINLTYLHLIWTIKERLSMKFTNECRITLLNTRTLRRDGTRSLPASQWLTLATPGSHLAL